MGKFTFLLACTLLISTARASLYMDSFLTMIDGMFTDATDLSIYVKWGIDLVWFSLAPIVAPLIGGFVTNAFDGTNTLSGIPLDEVLAIAGVHNKDYALGFVMNLVPNMICGISFLTSAGLCTASFSDAEKALCDALGFTDCVIL